MLARVLSWGLDRGLIAANPCERGGRLYRGSRAEKVWTTADEAAFLAGAPAHLHLPLLLALWTGQRQGDLLRLPWSAYDGKHIRLRQAKTGKPVVILVGAPLKAALDAAPKRSPIILTNSDGKPWTQTASARHGERRASDWRPRCDVSRLTRHGNHPARRGRSTEAEIANIPGTRCATYTRYSICTISRAILRSARTRSESSKGEQNLPTDLPTGLGCSMGRTGKA